MTDRQTDRNYDRNSKQSLENVSRNPDNGQTIKQTDKDTSDYITPLTPILKRVESFTATDLRSMQVVMAAS